ncbi:MAG: PepSY-associated TM helix domain-containing protein [Burkholderiaceae bacterium]
MRDRKTWFSIHRWLGIGLGLWFALVGLTGSVLVFEDPIDAWLNPDLLTTADRRPWLAPDAIVARATDDYALGKVERIRLPVAPGEVYRLFIRTAPNRRVGSERIEAFFNPVTGALLGTRGAETLGLSAPHVLKTVYEFHRNVLLGNAGANIVGIAGFLLLANAIAGFVIAWPRKREGLQRLVWVNWRGNATRILFDLHRSAGAIFFVLLVLATVTGSTLVYLNYVRDLVNAFSKVASFPTIPWVPGARDEPKSFGDIVGAVRREYPDLAITEIHGPPGRASGYLFYLKRSGDEHRLGDTIVWVHPITAQILVERSDRTRTAGETLMHWLFPLHSGTAFGTPGMVAMSATGAMPILLVLTGLWVWLRKRRGERIGRERRAARAAAATPSAPGQWQGMSSG